MKKFSLYLLIIFLLLSCSGSKINTSTSINYYKGLILTDDVNLRSEANITSKILKKLNAGLVVAIIDKTKKLELINDHWGYWNYIEINGLKGYIFSRYLYEFRNRKIIISDIFGKIFLLKDYKIFKISHFNSIVKIENDLIASKKIKYPSELIIFDIVDIYNDEYYAINTVQGRLSSEYAPISYKLFNKEGNLLQTGYGYYQNDKLFKIID